MAVIVYAADSIITDSYIQTGGEFRSSDGSPGLDISKNGSLYNFTYKDGLLTELTDADMIYGEMWNFTTGGWTFEIGSTGIYYNVSNFTAGNMNGFTFDASNLTTQFAGTYRIDWSVSFSGQAGSLYGWLVSKNGDQNSARECYSRRDTSGTQVGNVGGTCILDLVVGDNLVLQVEDEDGTPQNVVIYNMNVNAMKIGS